MVPNGDFRKNTCFFRDFTSVYHRFEEKGSFSFRKAKLRERGKECIENEEENLGKNHCPEKGIDTKCRKRISCSHRILRENAAKEKCPKNGAGGPEKLSVDISYRWKNTVWKEKTAWDKVFLTFSTEFSTAPISK